MTFFVLFRFGDGGLLRKVCKGRWAMSLAFPRKIKLDRLAEPFFKRVRRNKSRGSRTLRQESRALAEFANADGADGKSASGQSCREVKKMRR